jgi:hypothetical protein
VEKVSSKNKMGNVDHYLGKKDCDV